tara:strand:- start:365 stop:1153 length:789 start_codon:yes stop_codon:yes gene_type:complete
MDMTKLNSSLSKELKQFLKDHIKDMHDLKDFFKTPNSSTTQTYFGWDYILYKEHFDDDKFILYVNVVGYEDIDLKVLKTHISLIKQSDSVFFSRKNHSPFIAEKACELMLAKLLEDNIFHDDELHRLNLMQFCNPTCNNHAFFKAFICTFGNSIIFEKLKKEGPRLYMKHHIYNKFALVSHISKSNDILTRSNFLVNYDLKLGNKIIFKKETWQLDSNVKHINVPKGLKVGKAYYYEEHDKVLLAESYLKQYRQQDNDLSAA